MAAVVTPFPSKLRTGKTWPVSGFPLVAIKSMRRAKPCASVSRGNSTAIGRLRVTAAIRLIW